jgi:N utilization substance protein A
MVANITSHAITLNLGRTEAIMPRSQQVPGERYRIGQRIRAYVMEVRRTSRGPQIVVSRTHRRMLRRLLELEVPEIYNGTVEIKAIAREAGSRSKVAVAALQEGVDPVGSCVGIRGMRIQSIVNELGGEKIDVVEWNPDLSVFIANALSPARVKYAVLGETGTDSKTATVIVPDDQLSLAIGKEGQNARLAAKLTGWRIDIKSTSEAAGEALKPKGTLAAAPAKERDILAMAEAILLGKAAPESTEPGEVAEVASESAEPEIEREAAPEAAEPAIATESGQDDAILMEAEELLAQSAAAKGAAAQETAAQETAEEEIAEEEVVEQAAAVQEQAPAELATVEEIEAETEPVEEAVAEVEAPVAESKEPQVAEAEAGPELEVEPAPEEPARPASEPEPLGVLRREPEPQPKRIRKPKYEYVKDEQLEALEQPKKRSRRRRRRQLVLDEETGQMVSRPRHKREEDTENWSDQGY